MLKFLKVYFDLASALTVIAAAAGLVVWKTDSVHFYSVQTGSMAPVLQPGDLAITTKPDIKNLQIGDIISYKSPANPAKIITHRVYQISPAKGYIVTKGDNLQYADPPITTNLITGKAALAVPKVGRLLDLTHQPIGLISLIYLPALLVTGYELARLMAHFSRPVYGLDARAGS